MGEVGGGVPIGGGDDEPAKIDVRTRRRGGWHRWASPRALSMSLCRTVEDEEEAGEVDADVEVEACGRRAVGDSISSSARVKNRGITKKNKSAVARVALWVRVAQSSQSPLFLSLPSRSMTASEAEETE